jgi:hypothetical protein
LQWDSSRRWRFGSLPWWPSGVWRGAIAVGQSGTPSTIQVIGVTASSSPCIVPSWCALTADSLNVACKHSFRIIPYYNQVVMCAPPSDRGALSTIISGFTHPKTPWWHFYDPSSKPYFDYHLITDDFSLGLASRLRQLSIDQPEIPIRFWDRFQNDRGYLWDGLLVDQLALTAAEAGELRDAKEWLEEASPGEARHFDWSSNDHSLKHAQMLRHAGVGDVLVYRISRYKHKDGSSWEVGFPVIRLPLDPTRREKALTTLSDLRKEYSDAIRDYGQRYADGQ